MTLTFDQIKGILGFELPPSAFKYDMWWRGVENHPQAREWKDYGYDVERVNRGTHEARFKRIEEPVSVSLAEEVEMILPMCRI